MLALQIGVGLAVAAGVLIATQALGLRVAVVAIATSVSFAVTLVFTITVATGPEVPRLGKLFVCQILGADRTQPPSCGPRGLASAPVGLTAAAILLADGHRVPIVPGRVMSNIEFSAPSGNGFAPTADIEGWAAGVRDRRPVSSILVFSAAGRFVGGVSPTGRRPDVVAVFHDPTLERSGFSLKLPLRLVPGASAAPRLRLFALASGVASSMVFHCQGLNRQLGC